MYFDLGISFKAIALNKGKGLRPELYLVVIRCQDGIYMEFDNRVQWRAVVCYCDTCPLACHLSHLLLNSDLTHGCNIYFLYKSLI